MPIPQPSSTQPPFVTLTSTLPWPGVDPHLLQSQPGASMLRLFQESVQVLHPPHCLWRILPHPCPHPLHPPQKEVIFLLGILGMLSLFCHGPHQFLLLVLFPHLHPLYHHQLGKLLNDRSHTSSSFMATLHPELQMLIE